MQQVYAQISTTVRNPISNITSLQTLFSWVLNLVLSVGFSLVLVMLAMGFIRYIMSQGDKQGVETAQKWVTYAVVGGVGLLLVFAIRTIMNQVIGPNNVSFGNNVDVTF